MLGFPLPPLPLTRLRRSLASKVLPREEAVFLFLKFLFFKIYIISLPNMGLALMTLRSGAAGLFRLSETVTPRGGLLKIFFS